MAGMNRLLEGADRLRPLPVSSARVIEILSGDEPDLHEVAEIVRLDDALSIAVLRLANSAKFGVPGREFNLREATIRLGVKSLSRIVLQQQVSTVLDGDVRAFGLRRGALWRGALGGAFAAEKLAAMHASEVKEQAFVCALLRDIGKLVLDLKHGADYERLVAEHLTPNTTFDQAERAAFGADHAEVGAALAEHWKLPPEVADAIRHHHTPPTPDDRNHSVLYDIVHGADTICLWAGLAVGSDGLQYRLAPHVRESLALTRTESENEISLMWESLRAAEDVLKIGHDDRRVA